MEQQQSVLTFRVFRTVFPCFLLVKIGLGVNVLAWRLYPIGGEYVKKTTPEGVDQELEE